MVDKPIAKYSINSALLLKWLMMFMGVRDNLKPAEKQQAYDTQAN